MKKSRTVALLLCCAAATPAIAQAPASRPANARPATAVAARTAAVPTVLVRMGRLTPHETRVDVFTIATPQVIEIEATGADERFPRHGSLAFLNRMFDSMGNSNSNDPWRGNAWLINAKTRKVVWELRRAGTQKASDGIRGYKGTVRLEPGTYEAYFASYSSFRSTFRTRSPATPTREQVIANTTYDDNGVSKKFNFTIRGVGQALPASTYLQNVEAIRTSAFASLTGMKAKETRRVGFALDRPTRIDVYAIGEVQPGATFDYGTIINADTRETMWSLDHARSHPGGGAAKNRVAHQVVTLPAGRYAAIYTLDDTHDIGDWNAAPPYDPGFWGMTLRVVDAADRRNVKLFEYDPRPAHAVVSLTGIGDNDAQSAGFTLTKPMAVRVFAMGEGTRNDMDDYGWIIDAKTHRRVWSMQYGNTRHAGGDAKNRVAAEVVNLPAGSYIVSYRSDDSHSAADFNSGAPIDGGMWGITVTAMNAADRRSITAYDAGSEEGNVVARLIGMADMEDARATFKLDRPTDLRVYAIGEGSASSLSDYGYIEERGSKRRVWEMTKGMTLHAGGAEKNRMYDGVIKLPPGEYVVRWTSDDSHSFKRWNTDAPEDEAHWGITVYRVSGKQ